MSKLEVSINSHKIGNKKLNRRRFPFFQPILANSSFLHQIDRIIERFLRIKPILACSRNNSCFFISAGFCSTEKKSFGYNYFGTLRSKTKSVLVGVLPRKSQLVCLHFQQPKFAYIRRISRLFKQNFASDYCFFFSSTETSLKNIFCFFLLFSGRSVLKNFFFSI